MPTISRRIARHVALTGAVALGLSVLLGSHAAAAPNPVGLGTASSFAVLAGAGITNTGATTIVGDVGSFPTTTQTGFGSVVLTGTNHGGDAVTQGAKSDLVTAFNDAAGRLPVTDKPVELGGTTLTSGVYTNAATGTFAITNTLTLDFQNDLDAQFVFLTASTLITEVNSVVQMINGGDPCRVVWKVGTSATFKTGSTFVGDVLASASISAQLGATFDGRLLARDGAVTLINNTINRGSCAVVPAATTTTTTTIAPTTTTTVGVAPPVSIPTPTATSTTTSTTSTTSTTAAAPTTTVVATAPTTPTDPVATPVATADSTAATPVSADALGNPAPIDPGGDLATSGVPGSGAPDDPNDPNDPSDGPVSGDLPRTGSSSRSLFVLGLGLIVVGSAAVRLEQRAALRSARVG